MQLLRKYLFFVVFIFGSNELFAQQGKDLAKTVNTANNIVNEYTTLTVDASAGATTLTVAASGLNANGRFTATTGTLSPGDLLMVIQMQGATINGSFVEFPAGSGTFYGLPNDATWGDITNYNNCGNYEFVQVSSVPNSTTIIIDCGLKFDYTSAGKVQVIRVPRYSSLTVTSPGTIIPTTWTGSIGGIVAIEVSGNTVINNVGGISVSARGFRGGAISPNNPSYGCGQHAMRSSGDGQKGESIAGYDTDYIPFGGKYSRGAAANAGGGGDCHNAAGGGGANAGNISGWNGLGNPDNSGGAGWTAAWNLEGGTFSANTSSGGGRGGYSFSATNRDATVVPPGDATWTGDTRRNNGGLGGRPLDYSTGKLFLGGGGGSGDRDNSSNGVGGIAGGLVYLMNYGTISGTGSITANGGAGGNSGIDGAGGGGGGGTVVLNSVGAISGITVNANGGNGGDQVIAPGGGESEGPGGGGGGGYIALSNGVITMTAAAGANGTTNSTALTEFPPNGATAGGAGLINQLITNFTFSATDATICSGNTASLSVSFSGTVPGGTIINWYADQTGGSPIGTGTPFVTPVLASTTTYYVGTCPGNYRIPVVVTVNSAPSATITGTTTICVGNSTTLTGTGGGTYNWNTGATTTSITVSPASTTSYTVTVTNGGCTGSATAQVTVNSGISPTISGTTNICSGQNTILTANGGGTYSWNTGETTSSISVSPVSTTSYSITVTNAGCTGSATAQVTVGSLSPTITGTTTICDGTSTTLTATAGGTYSWNTGETTTSIIVSPSSTTSYSVTVDNGGCTGSATAQVIVNPVPTASISGTTTICSGQSTTLTAGGGGSYSWDTGATTTSITVSPGSTTTYTVIVNNSGCTGITSVQVTVNSVPTPIISGTTTICSGGTTTLSTSGGGSYSWNDGSTTSSIMVSPTITTTYSVTVTNSGCIGTASQQVTVGSGLSPTISGTQTVCTGGSTILSTSGGGTYSWNDGSTTSSITVSPTSTSTYSVTVTNGSCSGTASQQVVVNSNPIPVISGTTTICNGNSTVLSTSGAGTYLWNTGSTTSSITVSPSSTTTYSVTVNNGGCSGTASQQVIVNSNPTPVISGTTTICSGNSTTLSTSGAGTYLWNTGATTSSIVISPILTTTYTVTITNAGCSNSTTQVITVTPPITANITGNNICSGGNAILTASGGTSYSWSTGETTTIITVVPTSTTTYTITASVGSCNATASYTVIVDTIPVVTISPDITITYGNTTTLSVTGGGTYSWLPTAGLSCTNCSNPIASPTQTTQYCVVVSNTSGCSANACVTVTVDLKCGEVFVPNAFSPNNDGENDLECVFGNCIQTMNFVIFDRWGEKVFESSDPKQCWDGMYKGELMNTAVFVYYLNATLITGEKVDKKGNISLIR